MGSVWSPHLRKHDKEIEQLQRRATRLIKGFEHYNYPERLQELNLATLYYRRCDLIQVFLIIKQIDHINSDSFFDLNLGITRKNHIYKLHKPRCISTCSKDNSLQTVELSGHESCKLSSHPFINRFLNGFPDPSQFAAAIPTHYSTMLHRPLDSSRPRQRLLLSGGVHQNPGPATKYPCSVCTSNVTSCGVSYMCKRCSG